MHCSSGCMILRSPSIRRQMPRFPRGWGGKGNLSTCARLQIRTESTTKSKSSFGCAIFHAVSRPSSSAPARHWQLSVSPETGPWAAISALIDQLPRPACKLGNARSFQDAGEKLDHFPEIRERCRELDQGLAHEGEDGTELSFAHASPRPALGRGLLGG